MPTAPLIQFFTLVGVAVCLVAIWRGGPAERLGAWFILINLVLTMVAASFLAPSVKPVAQLVLDAGTALGLLIVAVRFGSLWLGCAMLLYAAQFTLHSFYFVTARPVDFFHATANNLDFLLVIVCLGVGTFVSIRNERRASLTSRS